MADSTDDIVREFEDRLARPFPSRDFVRFMRFVKIGAQGECWEWTGNKPDGRYGHFSVGQKTRIAHRWFYATLHGIVIPDDIVVRHKCDNPSCVNPDHLELGTSAQNRADMFHRGRGPDRRGAKHPLARLSTDEVIEIRRMADCGYKFQQLSGLFGVSRSQISRIVRREGWTNI